MSDSSIGHAGGSKGSQGSNDSPGRLGSQDDVILSRVGAFVIDHIGAFVTAAIVAVGFVFLLDSVAGVYVGAVLGYLGYFVIPEGMYGKTPGKKLAGLVVVNADGTPISFTDSVVRNLLRVIDGLFSYAVGLVIMLLNDDRQRLGDIVAGTVVVRAR